VSINRTSKLKNQDKKYKKKVILTKEEFEENLTDVFAQNYIPYVMVESESFRRFVSVIQPESRKFVLLGRKRLTKAITEKAERYRSHLKSVLTNMKYVCVTADLWKSHHR